MIDAELSRRQAFALTIGAGVLALAGCAKPPANLCSDPDKLTDAEIALRASVEYMEAAPDPARVCGGCAYFESPVDRCGTCKLLKGPVNSAGHCTAWSAPGKT